MTTSVTPAALQSGIVLTTVAAVMVVGPANGKAIIKQATFVNVTSGAVTITVARLPSGGSSLIVYDVQSIAANSTFPGAALLNVVLNAGDEITALASAAASINCFIDGFLTS